MFAQAVVWDQLMLLFLQACQCLLLLDCELLILIILVLGMAGMVGKFMTVVHMSVPDDVLVELSGIQLTH